MLFFYLTCSLDHSQAQLQLFTNLYDLLMIDTFIKNTTTLLNINFSPIGYLLSSQVQHGDCPINRPYIDNHGTAYACIVPVGSDYLNLRINGVQMVHSRSVSDLKLYLIWVKEIHSLLSSEILGFTPDRGFTSLGRVDSFNFAKKKTV